MQFDHLIEINEPLNPMLDWLSREQLWRGLQLRAEDPMQFVLALDACRKQMPDSVLLDWNMPVMNGIEFLKALRREFGPGNPPVLFCTTENDISFIEQAIEHGAQEFIMKPFDADILMGKFAQVGLA